MTEDGAVKTGDGRAPEDGAYDAEVFLLMDAAAEYEETSREVLEGALILEALLRECLFGTPGDGAWRKILSDGPAVPEYLRGREGVTGLDG